MKLVCWIFLLLSPHVLSIALHYDRNTKSYKELLISISPDIPGDGEGKYQIYNLSLLQRAEVMRSSVT